MRVATYTQASAVTRGSLVALLVLVGTILLGSSAVLRLIGHFTPGLVSVVTLMWLATYTMAFLGLMMSHGINWITWLARYRILLVILMVGTMMSIGWAFETRLSFERTIHLLGSTLIAIYIGFSVPLLTTLRVFGGVLAALLLASAGAALFLPELGIESYEGGQVWSGILDSKNTLGFWAATGVLLYITLSDSVQTGSSKMLCYVMAAISLVLLVFSQSATSLLVMIVAGALALYLFMAARFQLGFARMAVLAVLMTGIVVMIVSNISTAELVGRSGDLTGRGEVWRQTWGLIMQRPLTGFGYGVLWFPSDDTTWIQEALTDFTWTVHHAHNGFLQVASEIGLPLAVVALLMVIQQLIEIIYCQYQRQQVGVLFVLAFSIAYLLSNFSEARFLINRELFWILFIALPISMLRQINLVAPSPQDTRVNPHMPAGGGAGAMGPRPARPPAATASPRPQAPLGLPTADAANQAQTSDDSWTEEDFDRTVQSLGLSDADIDLGTTGSRVAANDDAASAQASEGASAEMLDALDELFESQQAPEAQDADPDTGDDPFEMTFSDQDSESPPADRDQRSGGLGG